MQSKSPVKDEQKKKATIYDLTTNIGHAAFIPNWKSRNLVTKIINAIL